MLFESASRTCTLALFAALAVGCQSKEAGPKADSPAEPVAEGARVDAKKEAAPEEPKHEAGSEAAARHLVGKLIDTATRSETVLGLEPTSADYVAVYGPQFGPALEAFYKPMWAKREIVPSPWGPDQTEVLITRAGAEDLRAWQGDAAKFPRGYKRIAEFLQEGVVLHQFRFTKPGEPRGASWDGLVWVNGKWKIMPKPWKAAPEGSPFYRANEAEALCAHLQSVGADPSSKADCEAQMSKRLIEAGSATFQAYAACVKGLDDASRLADCEPRLGGQAG